MGCGGGRRSLVRAEIFCAACGSRMTRKTVNVHPSTRIDDKSIKSVFQCDNVKYCGRHIYNKERNPIVKVKF